MSHHKVYVIQFMSTPYFEKYVHLYSRKLVSVHNSIHTTAYRQTYLIDHHPLTIQERSQDKNTAAHQANFRSLHTDIMSQKSMTDFFSI